MFLRRIEFAVDVRGSFMVLVAWQIASLFLC